jgi:hypothetical protein
MREGKTITMTHLDSEQLHSRLLELSEEFSLYAQQTSEGSMGMIADKLKALAKEITLKRP